MRRLRGEMSEEDHYHGWIKLYNYDGKELPEFFRGLFFVWKMNLSVGRKKRDMTGKAV